MGLSLVPEVNSSVFILKNLSSTCYCQLRRSYKRLDLPGQTWLEILVTSYYRLKVNNYKLSIIDLYGSQVRILVKLRLIVIHDNKYSNRMHRDGRA